MKIKDFVIQFREEKKKRDIEREKNSYTIANIIISEILQQIEENSDIYFKFMLSSNMNTFFINIDNRYNFKDKNLYIVGIINKIKKVMNEYGLNVMLDTIQKDRLIFEVNVLL